ncbi:hypothetical protein BTA51_14075 [Hahella sp. CCB-MM4]|uniref:hypothetical protein n=1 Tax=Hahella sp. (strain CCB-MM4) TaxID=1926491 RepID=UPI000BCD7EB0|nr:hypothetical protein [Hahella sp. CCB-MM4]OZG72653.1 hypothetical protein BTA51_14075 [Hahella sp. CCB-MM4]
MVKRMCKPKAIEDITVEDLKAHRWCFYEDEEGCFSAFEHVVPDSHPEFSEHIAELELSEFKFANGKVLYGVYDGFEAFNIIADDEWYSFWYGADEPELEDLERLESFLTGNNLLLPVVATAKWSGTTKTYNGIQYINSNGETIEKVI